MKSLILKLKLKINLLKRDCQQEFMEETFNLHHLNFFFLLGIMIGKIV